MRFLLALAAVLWCARAPAQCQPQWFPPTPLHAPQSPIVPSRQMFARTEGGSDYLYLAGGFWDGERTRPFARWDGHTIDFPGESQPNYSTNDFCEFEGDLIAAGIGRSGVLTLARWDGQAWSLFGDASWGGYANDVAVYRGELYVAGSFYPATPPYRTIILMRWTGSAFEPVEPPTLFFPDGKALEVWDDRLILGGSFQFEINSQLCSGLAAWDGTNWSCMNPPATPGTAYPTMLSNWIDTLAVHEGSLYTVSTWYFPPQFTAQPTLVRWTGATWELASPGFSLFASSSAMSLKSVGDSLLFTGNAYPPVATAALSGVVALSGTTWQPVARGVEILDATLFRDELYLGGNFQHLDGFPIFGFGVLRAGRWRPLGPTLVASGQAVASVAGDLVTYIDAQDPLGNLIRGVVRLVGRSWEQLGSDSAAPTAIGEFQGQPVAGFGQTPDGYPARRWDGTSWITLGQGIQGPILDFQEHAGALYAVTNSTNPPPGPALVLGVIRWNGSDWESLSFLLSARALHSSPDGLVALCQTNGASPAAMIWSESAWIPWNAPRIGTAFTAIRWRGLDIMAGRFSTDTHVVVYRNSQWERLGHEVFSTGDTVVRLLEWNGDLIAIAKRVAGSATPPLADPAIYRFDGESWTPFLTNVPSLIHDAVVHDNKLAIVGNFGSVDGVSSRYVALYGCPPCPADLTTTASPALPGYGVPDGTISASDFLYYLPLFAAADPRADLTSNAFPGAVGFGIPDTRVNSDDFFYFISAFGDGC